MSTLDLPFVVAPQKVKRQRIGTKATGVLELPVLGSLQVGEVITVSDLTDEEESSVVLAAKLAQRISAEQQISVSEAFALVEAAALGKEMGEEQDAIRLQYLPEVAALTKSWVERGRRRMLASVTALIQHRLERPEWTMAETVKLPQPLMEALFAFFEAERTAAEPDSAAPPSEDEIKKPLPVDGNPTA